MVSINDVFSELQAVNTNLQQLHNDVVAGTAATNAVRASVDQVNGTLVAGFTVMTQGFQVLANLEHLTNVILFHIAQQEDTIICDLEKISKNTCELLNEATVQTGLQHNMETAEVELRELYGTGHAEAALGLEQLKKVRADLEACCPPEPTPPACTYEPCPTPPRLRERPKEQDVPQFVQPHPVG